MSLPKIKDFTDFNHYPSDPQPTTDADMQEYMQNQNDILNALTKRLWQPQTEYKLGDIVASDTMADGLVAVCTIAGVTSDIEPEWGVNEATVIDNSCTWIMRPAYCYGLATEGDVQTVYDGGEAEVSRLLSLGVVGKIFNLLKSFINEKIKDLFGESNILPIVNGGTGATSATQARVNLGLDSTTGLTPTGTIIAFSGNNIPSGYLPCNGSAVSRTTYADLFAVIGTTYGSGDGSTTFNLPNLTDKFIQGSDTAGTVKSAGLPNITGRRVASWGGGDYVGRGYTTGCFKQNSDASYPTTVDGGNWNGDGNGSGFSFDASLSNPIYGASATVQPPALTMRYIIKY